MLITQFKRQPREKQLEALNASKDATEFGLFLEQRCGKSQVALDTAAYHYRAGRIDTLLIIAPAGVHRVWVDDEIPLVLPDDTAYRCVLWRSGRMQSKKNQHELAELLIHAGLAVLSVNIDAIITPTLKAYLDKLLKTRRVMTVIDESTDISSPKAQRTRVAMRIGRLSVIRRILDGAPVSAKPFGLYSQCNFLKPGILGFTSFFAFKQRYATWETGYAGSREYPILKSYQNLDELQEKLRRFSYRVTRAECADLPPKIYEKRYFELSKLQRQTYDDLRSTFVAELSSGEIVTAAMVLTRYLRLQQVTSNFIPTDASVETCPACHGDGCDRCNDLGFFGRAPTEITVDATCNPRLDALRETIAPLAGQGVIWARFRRDVTAIVAELGSRAVRYDGAVPADERARSVRRFQDGNVEVFVGNARAGGRGLDLSTANWMIYYSLDWSLRWRLQSEDRAQSLKKTDAVLYVDLIAEDTVDERIIKALRDGRNLSDLILPFDKNHHGDGVTLI